MYINKEGYLCEKVCAEVMINGIPESCWREAKYKVNSKGLFEEVKD